MTQKTGFMMKAEIEDFLSKKKGNLWFESDNMKVYLRVYTSPRFKGRTVDIGSVEVFVKGKGTYTAFVEWLIKTAKKLSIDYIRFECVLEPRLVPFYAQLGALPIPLEPECYVLSLNDKP